MLVIRMQRTGRKGHAQFRVVVQDSRWTPTSGKVVASLGNYNPHTKEATIDSEKISFYLEHGAQPSARVASLLKTKKIKLPKWVNEPTKLKRTTRNPDKLRKNQPKAEATVEPKAEEPKIEVEEVAKEPAQAEPKKASAEEPKAEEPSKEEAKPETVSESDKKE